jgi:hypothetical protein
MYNSDFTCAPCFQPAFYGYFNSFFILFWTFSTGLFFSAFVVSHALYNPRSPFCNSSLSDEHDSDSDSSDQQFIYTDLFPLNNNNHYIPADNVHIIENTPNGNVIMSYSNIEEGFIYYADKNIPFDVLETVARKFCNSFDCGALYVSRKSELDNNDSDNSDYDNSASDNDSENSYYDNDNNNSASDNDIQNSKSNNDNDELNSPTVNNNDSPFASLKTYNSNKNPITQIDSQIAKHNPTACKFVRKGKFNDFTPIIHSPSPSKKISFKDFKNSL